MAKRKATEARGGSSAAAEETDGGASAAAPASGSRAFPKIKEVRAYVVSLGFWE